MKMEEFDFKPGTLLAGRYLLQEHLGRGGMGTVWLAKDEELDDLPVATKLLLPELANDSQFITSLKEEAKSSMKLSHPNIVRVFNLHRDEKNGSVAFLVLKYVKGGTMKEILQEWPQGVPLERVLRWAGQLASALDYAHVNGVIHRDIKPSNIMIDKDTDSALLMDFGISRQCDQTLRTGSGSSGTGLGTLAYMSPQQLHDKDCASNDIYSLAATLYQALSGRAPFIGTEIEEKILRSDPEPIEGISDVVNRALLAGLAKSEDDRPETAEDLVDLMKLALDSTTRTGPTTGTVGISGASGAGPGGEPISRRKFSVLKLTVAILLIGGAGLFSMKPDLLGFAKEGDEPSSEVMTTSDSGETNLPNEQSSDPKTLSDSESFTNNEAAGDIPTGADGQVAQGGADPLFPPSLVVGDDQKDDQSINTDDSTRALFGLVRSGDLVSVERELAKAKGAGNLAESLEQIDPNTGYRLIHAAAASGRADMVSAILRAGALIESLGSMPRQVTPLLVAVEFGRLNVVKLLLDSGADITARDGGENTALHLAAERCRSQRDYNLILLLTDAGGQIDTRNIQGQTPADIVPITSAFHEAAMEALK